MRKLVAVAALGFALSACGGGDDGGEAEPEADTGTEAESDGELQPADEVLADEASAEAVEGELGEPVDLGEGLTVIVNGMSVNAGGDVLGPWLEVDTRVENTGEAQFNPNLSIVCEGSPEEGGWQADSSFVLFAPLPADTFNEGTVNLLLPGDNRTGEPVPECATPAVVRVLPSGADEVMVDDLQSQQATADFPITDELIGQLNAERVT